MPVARSETNNGSEGIDDIDCENGWHRLVGCTNGKKDACGDSSERYHGCDELILCVDPSRGMCEVSVQGEVMDGGFRWSVCALCGAFETPTPRGTLFGWCFGGNQEERFGRETDAKATREKIASTM